MIGIYGLCENIKVHAAPLNNEYTIKYSTYVEHTAKQ